MNGNFTLAQNCGLCRHHCEYRFLLSREIRLPWPTDAYVSAKSCAYTLHFPFVISDFVPKSAPLQFTINSFKLHLNTNARNNDHFCITQ